MANRKSSDSRPASPTFSRESQGPSRRKSESTPNIEIGINERRASQSSQQDHRTGAEAQNECSRPKTPSLRSSEDLGGVSPGGWTKRQPRHHTHDGDNQGNESQWSNPNVILHDIRQSRWIENPNNHALENVYLVAEDGPLSVMSTIETDFCWVHHKRDRDMQFEDFVRTVDEIPGLFTHEHKVARKCLQESKNMRRTFANGKYFEPMVHQVKESVEIIAGERTDVKATFVSIPVFSSMQCRKSETDHIHLRHHHHHSAPKGPLRMLFQKIYNLVHEEGHHRGPSTRELLKRDVHPIRSLMQYTNILAVDYERDWQQAITRLSDNVSDDHPFIHVPELWILVINMYTIVTCAPFSVEELRSDNITQLKPSDKDRRINVRYTKLNGALHEFRCRTWVGLLNTIATIEQQIPKEDELSVQLTREDSMFRLVDAKFRLLDRKRWQIIASNKSTLKVSVRLFKMRDGHLLDVSYSTRKFWTSRGIAWDLMSQQVVSENLRKTFQEVRKRAKLASVKESRIINETEIRDIQHRIDKLHSKLSHMKRARTAQRFLYAAVRYYLIDPGGQLFDDDQVYLEAVRNRRLVARAESLSPTDFATRQLGNDNRAPSLRHRGARSSQPATRSQSRTSERRIAADVSRNGRITQPSSRLASPNNRRMPMVENLQGSAPTAQSDLRPQEIVKEVLASDNKILERFGLPPTRSLEISKDTLPIITTRARVHHGGVKLPPGALKKARTSVGHLSPYTGGRSRGSLPRALTLPEASTDVEGQISKGSHPLRPMFPPRVHPVARTPVIIVNEDNADILEHDASRQERNLSSKSLKLRTEAPAIFRSRAPIPSLIQSGPIAIVPDRLPPTVGETEFLPRHAVQSHVRAQLPPLILPTSSDTQTRRPFRSISDHTPAADSPKTSNTLVDQQPPTLSPWKWKDLKSVEPFFEWTVADTTGAVIPRDGPSGSDVRTSKTVNGLPLQPKDPGRAIKHAKEILDILLVEMSSGYFVNEEFSVQPSHFIVVEMKQFQDVLTNMEIQLERVQAEKRDHEERMRIWNLKVDIILSVDTILRCFVGKNNQDEPLIQKIWGILYAISVMSFDELKTINEHSSSRNHRLRVLIWIKMQISQIEQVCQEILFSARSDTGNHVEQLDIPLPPAFTSQFRDIVLFLLSSLHLLNNGAIALGQETIEQYQRAAETVRDIINDGWIDCETALLRDARDFKEKGDDHEYLQESITTTDTLLGLFLQNALSISCSEVPEDDKDLAFCDIEFIYRSWSTICHEKAIREASAEMYEEVRCLREELGAITTVLEHQKQVFDKIVEVRESPNHTLDMRINKRTEAFLDDMLKHFTTLRNYAAEAETLNINYIRVNNEDNSKAIFVFTVVTLIFLPLNFISSILGMNTSDIRNMTRSSRLFWEISFPFMATVLVLAFILVKIRSKVKLKRRIGLFLLRLFPSSWGTEHAKIRNLALCEDLSLIEGIKIWPGHHICDHSQTFDSSAKMLANPLPRIFVSVDTLEYVGFSPKAAKELMAEYRWLCDNQQSEIKCPNLHFGDFILIYSDSMYHSFDGDSTGEMTLRAIGAKRSVIRGICDSRFQDLRATRTPGEWFAYSVFARLTHIVDQKDKILREWWLLFPERIEDLPSDHVMLHAGGPIYSMVRAKAWNPGCFMDDAIEDSDQPNLLATMSMSVCLTEDRAAATRNAKYAKAILPELECGIMCIMVPKSMVCVAPCWSERVWKEKMLEAVNLLKQKQAGQKPQVLSLCQDHDIVEAPIPADNIKHLINVEHGHQIRAQRFDGRLTKGYYICGRALKRLHAQCSEKWWIEPIYKSYDDEETWRERRRDVHEELLNLDQSATAEEVDECLQRALWI